MTDKQVYLLAAAICFSGGNLPAALIGGVFLFAACSPEKKPPQPPVGDPDPTITLKYRL